MHGHPYSYLRILRCFLVPLAMLAVVACSSNDNDVDVEAFEERPVGELYNEALNLLDDTEYTLAAEAFDEVERQHPYSVWANRAQLMAAYAYYQARKYDDAIVALDRFIQLHPGHNDVAYAYYLRALCNYEQISDVGRDQQRTVEAMDALKEVVKRFPDSEYARDARLKLDLTTDHLAGKEMEIGRYYLGKKQYLAAINRFKAVVGNFQTTTHIPEALYRLCEAYAALGLLEESKKSAAVLGYNFPGNEWYTRAYWVAGMGQAQPNAPEKHGKWLGWIF